MIAIPLASHAARRPDAIALRYGERRIGYRDLHQRACRVARALAGDGIGPGDRVATMMHNCPQFFEILFGCAMLGAICVPINFRLARPEVERLLAVGRPRLLLAAQTFQDPLGRVHELPPTIRWLDDQPPTSPVVPDHPYERWLQSAPARETTPLPAADAPLMLMHSSGTSGLPKGIIVTHSTVLASSSAKTIDFGLTRSDTCVVFGPLFHIGPLMDLALPVLLCGGQVVIGTSRQFDPQCLLETISACRGTVVPIYPTMLRRVIATRPDPTLDLTSLRLIITGGEAAPAPVIRATIERFPGVAFVNNYGSTEGGPITTFLPPEDALRKIGSVGRESYSVQLRIDDESGRPLGPGEIGELVVRSPFVCAGYWGRPAESAAQRRNGWWRTGDCGWLDAEGDLWIVGRSQDLIKCGGENVYPIEVEQVICELDEVVEVAVLGIPDDQTGEAVVAYIVCRPDGLLGAARVLGHCQAGLADFKQPRHLRFVDQLPRGTTNKVDRRVLRRWWDDESHRY